MVGKSRRPITSGKVRVAFIVRKDIARIYTVLTERELGIIDDPDAEEAKE